MQLAGHHGSVPMPVRMLVRNAMGQDVPDDHEQLARHRDNGLAVAQGGHKAFELGLPEGMVLDGAPGRFDQHGPQLATTLLGDGAGMGPVWCVWPEAWTLAPKPL